MPDLPHSPAADRNKEPILAQLRHIVGEQGRALEVASGTGQHVTWFAAAMPGWQWQPTEAEPELLAAIAARVAQSGLTNVLPPRLLDVTQAPWPRFGPPFDAIFCANLLHIAPWEACRGLMSGAAGQLAPGGCLVTYGPCFERDVVPAPSNLAFDESLRARDARWGIRALDDVVAQAQRAGLRLAQRHAMPANNLLLVFRAG